MKKRYLLIAALFLLTACGNDGTQTAETGSTQTEAVTELSAETTAEATTETTTETEETTTETTEAAEKRVGPLMEAVNQRITDWDKGDVCIKFGQTVNGIDVRSEVCSMKDNFAATMKMGSYTLDVRSCDGKAYIVDKINRTFAETEDPEAQAESLGVSNMMAERYHGRFKKSGEATFRGATHTYEEYKNRQGQTIRFFFDDEGEILGCTVSQLHVKTIEMDYDVQFLETTDPARYRVPDGYREISKDEMLKASAEQMAGMMKNVVKAGANG